ncbi:glutathione S-transferase Mu 4-like [Babylonia areolata]|uniref:glutathione S-transferase Mu 4-like n=1 Tax=Babylonia areolata TaxID=304850 RepID=UPI003FCFEC81
MPTLAYWKIRGLAQPIRLLLNYAGEEFEDVYYEQGDAPDFSREEWYKVKQTLGLDFPNLPYYIDGDVKITQSNAILRHIARKYKLLGETMKEMADVDMMLENSMDFRNGVVRMCYNKDYDTLIKDYEKKTLPGLLEGYNKWMDGKEWFGGGKNVTVADFPMYELLDQHELMIPGCLEKYTNLTAFVKRFEELEKIKAYMASPKFMKWPVNNKVAMFK